MPEHVQSHMESDDSVVPESSGPLIFPPLASPSRATVTTKARHSAQHKVVLHASTPLIPREKTQNASFNKEALRGIRSDIKAFAFETRQE